MFQEAAFLFSLGWLLGIGYLIGLTVSFRLAKQAKEVAEIYAK